VRRTFALNNSQKPMDKFVHRFLRIARGPRQTHTVLPFQTSPENTMQVRTPKQKQRGQGMTEYIIIVALVAVAAIAVYQLFGQVIRSQTAAMAQELAGEDGSAQSQTAQSAAQAATAQAAAKSLKSFTGNAAAGQ
jgi:flagellar biosynthesis/type III secretory pathway M-ring protein FliF/YscJ